MSCPSLELLPAHALGTGTRPEREALDLHLGECPGCATELRALQTALLALPLAVPPVEPPPALRERLLGGLGSRFAGWEERVGSFFRVSVEEGRQRLALIDDPASWQAGPLPGLSVIHFPLPPGLPAGHAGFVRLAAGTSFPAHTHLGEEYALVLQGGCRDSGGTVARRGDQVQHRPGTRHSLSALAGPDCVFAALVEVGVEFSGEGHEP